MSESNETRFEPNADTADRYIQRTMMGHAACKNLRVAFFMIARQCASSVDRTMSTVNSIASKFKSSSIFVYENDSTDATADKFKAYRNVNLMSTVQRKRKWQSIRHPSRGTDMARYRNAVRELGLSDPYDVACVLDTDLAWVSIHGFFNSMGYWGQWDWIASNGLRRSGQSWLQVDAWALRATDWRASPFVRVKGYAPKRGEPLRPVLSAFGGMALYTSAAYKSSTYGGGDCEHVRLHQAMHNHGYKRGFLNPSQITVYRW